LLLLLTLVVHAPVPTHTPITLPEYLSNQSRPASPKVIQADLNDLVHPFFNPTSKYAVFLNKFVQGAYDLPVTKGRISGLPIANRRGLQKPREAPSLLFFNLPDQTDEPYNQAERILAEFPGKRYLPLFGVSGNTSFFFS
jgi:hypothetical protein